MLPTLTKRQKEILDYIQVYTNLKGYSPSLEEIKEHFNLSAVSTVHEHLNNLQEKGYISKQLNQSRGTRLIDLELKNQDLIEIPVIATIIKDGQSVNEKTKTVLVSKQLLAEKGNYFAYRLGNLDLDFENLELNDILVFVESSAITPQSIKSTYICKIAKDSLHIGKFRFGPQTSFFSYINQKTYSRFQVTGKLVLVIRKYE